MGQAKQPLQNLCYLNYSIATNMLMQIALSPFNPASVSIQSGRLMLERIHHLANQKANFSFETTMASRSFAPFLVDCKNNNYKINLIFLWLQSSDLAMARVKDRVARGGHHIPTETILRRYRRSIHHFLNIYSSLADDWVLYDNSSTEPTIIAEKKLHKPYTVHNQAYWQKFQESSHE